MGGSKTIIEAKIEVDKRRTKMESLALQLPTSTSQAMREQIEHRIAEETALYEEARVALEDPRSLLGGYNR